MGATKRRSFCIDHLQAPRREFHQSQILRAKKRPGHYPSPLGLVEPGGIEPPSASPLQAVLHA